MFPVVANELNKVRRYKSTKQASNQTDRSLSKENEILDILQLFHKAIQAK